MTVFWVVRVENRIIGCKNAPAADAVAAALNLTLDRQRSSQRLEEDRCARLSNCIAQASDDEANTWGRKRKFLTVDDAATVTTADFVEIESQGCTR